MNRIKVIVGKGNSVDAIKNALFNSVLTKHEIEVTDASYRNGLHFMFYDNGGWHTCNLFFYTKGSPAFYGIEGHLITLLKKEGNDNLEMIMTNLTKELGGFISTSDSDNFIFFKKIKGFTAIHYF